MLLDRRNNRSSVGGGTFLANQDDSSRHNLSYYSQNQHSEDDGENIQHYQRDFGGYNPEALYQEDVIQEYSQQRVSRSNSKERSQ